MRDILERLREYNPPDRTIGSDYQASVDIAEAAEEIAFLVERLNLCLTIEKKLRHNAEQVAIERGR
jgi:hypothetical protein